MVGDISAARVNVGRTAVAHQQRLLVILDATSVGLIGRKAKRLTWRLHIGVASRSWAAFRWVVSQSRRAASQALSSGSTMAAVWFIEADIECMAGSDFWAGLNIALGCLFGTLQRLS